MEILKFTFAVVAAGAISAIIILSAIARTSPEPTKTVAIFTEETQELERTCHFLRCLYVAEDKLGMELVCSQTPAICPPEERIDQ